MAQPEAAACDISHAAAEPEPITTWRCPRCLLWVKEAMGKRCALCNECIAEEADDQT